MKTAMRYFYVIVALSCLFAISSGCKETQDRRINTPDGAQSVSEEEACKDEGGRFRDGECECPSDDDKWDGQRCQNSSSDQTVTFDKPEDVCKEGGGNFDKDEDRCICSNGKVWNSRKCVNKDEDNPLDADTADKLKERCVEGNGSWISSEQYCNCIDKKVLLDDRCSTMEGKMTDELCSKAVIAGSYRGERCKCADGEAFVAGRGGCSPRLKRTSKYLQNICEDTLNAGKWDIKNRRCDCPTQKIWQNDNCVPQYDMSIREICTGDFNQGTWDSTKRFCECRDGYLWHSSICKVLKDVPENVACAAPINNGTWAKPTCKCKDDKYWAKEQRLCIKMDPATATQLCKSSGGAPVASPVGKCTCPATHVVKLLAPINYEYCIPKPNQPQPTPTPTNEEMPMWLKILLGLTEG